MSLEMSKGGMKFKALVSSLVPFSFLFSRFFLFILPLVRSLGPFLNISLHALGGVNHKALVPWQRVWSQIHFVSYEHCTKCTRYKIKWGNKRFQSFKVRPEERKWGKSCKLPWTKVRLFHCTLYNATSSQTVQPPAEGGQGGEDKQQQQALCKHPRGGDHPRGFTGDTFDLQVILFCPILTFFFKFLVEEIIPEGYQVDNQWIICQHE